jgi:hypothetical protein
MQVTSDIFENILTPKSLSARNVAKVSKSLDASQDSKKTTSASASSSSEVGLNSNDLDKTTKNGVVCSVSSSQPKTISQLLNMLFNRVRQEPQILAQVIEFYELKLKAMTEKTNVFYRTFEYAFLTSSLFVSDELITLEVLGRLGRKLEPSGNSIRDYFILV